MNFNDKIKKVLIQALQNPFMIQSDFAREFAHAVSASASRGLITTTRYDSPGHAGINGRKWFITMAGLTELNNIISKDR